MYLSQSIYLIVSHSLVVFVSLWLAACLSLTLVVLFSGGYDQIVRQWAIGRAGLCVRKFTGHSGMVRGVAVSSDGHYLISAAMDGTGEQSNWLKHSTRKSL